MPAAAFAPPLPPLQRVSPQGAFGPLFHACAAPTGLAQA